METKIIDGIEHTKESDYLAAPFGAEVNHVLVDIQDGQKITAEKMNAAEKEKRNNAARKAGEPFLVWCPALFA